MTAFNQVIRFFGYAIMKLLSILLIGLVSMLSCGPTDLLPINTWSVGCMQLSPTKDGYSLAGVGNYCSGLTIPRVKLRKNDTFTVDGLHYTYVGAASNKQAVRVTGTVSSDGQTLMIAYSIDTYLFEFSLKPGSAKQTCSCIQM